MSEEPNDTDDRLEGMLRRWGAEEAATRTRPGQMPLESAQPTVAATVVAAYSKRRLDEITLQRCRRRSGCLIRHRGRPLLKGRPVSYLSGVPNPENPIRK